MADTTTPAAPAAATAAAPATTAPATTTPAAQQQGEEIAVAETQDGDDVDSSIGDDESQFESTASIASSILEYRTIQGRTFHSERHNSEYFTPNDEQQRNSIDITHHYLQLLLADKLYLAPIKDDIEKILDIGTGTGIWAIDMADAFPNTQIIGTDLSPIQPVWVPPNLKFEIDDCTKEWTWPDNTFDFVHLRVLIGAISDWGAFFKQAYRTLKPGGWMQSAEPEVIMLSDDDTIPADSPYHTLTRLLTEGGAKLGNSFRPVTENFQNNALEAAGFVDRHEITYKVPVGGWARDTRLAETGRFVQLTLENDIEGYTLFIWNNVLQWPAEEYQVFLALMRRELRNKRLHAYFKFRYVWARKPEEGEEVPAPAAAAEAAAEATEATS